MYPERQKGLTYSAVFHLLILLFAIFGLPSLMPEPHEEQEIAITLVPLPISEKSNIPLSQQNPAPTPKPEVKPEPPAPEPKKEEPPKPKPPAPPVKTEQAEPPPPPEKPIVKPEVKPTPPKPEKPKKEQPKKASEADLAAVLKAVQDQAHPEDKKPDKPAKKKSNSGGASMPTKSSQFDPTQQMSMDERSAIMSQLAQCWSPPMGAKDAHTLVVVVAAEFNSDGSYTKVGLSSESESRYNSGDPMYRAAAEAAIRAVKECSPLKNLPTDKYQTWREMELRFDPKNLL